MNHEAASDTHVRFQRAVRGVLVAEAALDQYRTRDVGWEEVRESWTRLQRNGKPTPWDGLIGAAAARTGTAADLGSGGRRTASKRGSLSDGDRVWIDHERYYYSLPPGTATPPFVVEGALTWRYVGQQVYSSKIRRERTSQWIPASQSPERGFAPPATLDDALGVGRASQTDGVGRRWLLHAVDHEAWYRATKGYSERVRAEFGRDETVNMTSPRQAITEPRSSDDVDRFMTTNSSSGYWHQTCSGQIINSPLDDLAPSSTPLNVRGRKVVQIVTDGVGADDYIDADSRLTSNCSGTMIDGKHVLTAAHCLTDPVGNPYDFKGSGGSEPTNPAVACTFGNLSSSTGASYQKYINCTKLSHNHPNPSWNGTLFQADYIGKDYGIVTMADRLDDVVAGEESVIGWMAISSAADADITGTSDYHRGYPRVTSSCDLNSFTGVDGNQFGSEAHDADGKLDSVKSQTINYETSTGKAMSGGPHYYCPHGSCDDGHYITSVQSSSWGTSFWVTYAMVSEGASIGPKASTFREWVAGFAFNYL